MHAGPQQPAAPWRNPWAPGLAYSIVTGNADQGVDASRRLGKQHASEGFGANLKRTQQNCWLHMLVHRCVTYSCHTFCKLDAAPAQAVPCAAPLAGACPVGGRHRRQVAHPLAQACGGGFCFFMYTSTVQLGCAPAEIHAAICSACAACSSTGPILPSPRPPARVRAALHQATKAVCGGPAPPAPLSAPERIGQPLLISPQAQVHLPRERGREAGEHSLPEAGPSPGWVTLTPTQVTWRPRYAWCCPALQGHGQGVQPG